MNHAEGMTHLDYQALHRDLVADRPIKAVGSSSRA